MITENKIINKYLKKKIDIIFVDTTHTANHVEKIFYLYFKKLKINGIRMPLMLTINF